MCDDRRACFNKAVLVGKMLSIVLPLQNKSFLHLFIVRQSDVRFYKSLVNLSIIDKESSIGDKKGWSLRMLKIRVIPLNKSQTFQNDHFVTWDRKDTWSYPVNACKNESPRALDSRRLLKIMWTGTYFLHFPAPKSTHNFSGWSFKRASTETASTNTSVSTVWMIIFEWPYRVMSMTCKNILVFASSWLQREMDEEATWFVLVMQVIS